MASAYETMMEHEQKTIPRGSMKIRVTNVELNDLEIHGENDMQETTSLQTSPITGDSSNEKITISSVEVSILPSEFFDGDLNISNEEAQTMMDRSEKEGNKEKGSAVTTRDVSSSVYSITDNEMNNSKNEESTSENHSNDNKRNETKKSPSVLTENRNPRYPAIVSTCDCIEKIKDQDTDQGKSIEIENQNTHDNKIQEQCSRDNIEGNTDETLSACCKNIVELGRNTEDEVERDNIVDRLDDLSFYDAVRSGDVKRISALIASGSVQNLDEPDWNVSGDPPLLMAATNHCLPVLSTLLANGCDPAVRSPRGETALHRVILNGGPSNVLQFVEDLLKHGCPPGVKEAGNSSTALHVLSRQLAHMPVKSLHRNFDAAIKTLDLLAKAGPINAKDHQGRGALHILASSTIFDNNHKSDVESLIGTLLAAGVDTALKNDRGETALHESLECGALNVAIMLIPHTTTGITSRYGETPLHIASRKNYVSVVMKLLERGEDPSVQDAGGNTPLHLASARGFHETVSLLVTSPLAQLEKVNIDGLTALQVATESGFVNAVRILLKAGADPSQTANYCTTILRRHPDISILINHELTRRRQLAA